jgi:hypothetical protein
MRPGRHRLHCRRDSPRRQRRQSGRLVLPSPSAGEEHLRPVLEIEDQGPRTPRDILPQFVEKLSPCFREDLVDELDFKGAIAHC